jgi:outer membrane usher protein FimD/PapC
MQSFPEGVRSSPSRFDFAAQSLHVTVPVIARELNSERDSRLDAPQAGGAALITQHMNAKTQ